MQILRLLAEARSPLNSIRITELMNRQGHDISERSVRMYLNRLDEERLTISHGKKGREITHRGLEEINSEQLLERVGFMSAKIDNMTYRMSFDLALRRGTVAVNLAIVEQGVFLDRLDMICEVFAQGYAMGSLVALLYPGEHLGELTVPPGHLGFCTVCSVTLNGVLLKHGIPTRSIFSGLLDLEDGRAKRFSERINYDGTSIDPLQLFIRARLTNYVGAITDGNGRIGAGFREIPESSYDLANSLSEKLESLGLKAFLQIGKPSEALLNIPVTEGSCGIIVIGGLNPVAILEETGADVTHYALSGLMEYNRLFEYSELHTRLKQRL